MYARSCETDVTGTAQSTGQAGNSGPGQGDGDSPVDGGGPRKSAPAGRRGAGKGVFAETPFENAAAMTVRGRQGRSRSGRASWGAGRTVPQKPSHWPQETSGGTPAMKHRYRKGSRTWCAAVRSSGKKTARCPLAYVDSLKRAGSAGNSVGRVKMAAKVEAGPRMVVSAAGSVKRVTMHSLLLLEEMVHQINVLLERDCHRENSHRANRSEICTPWDTIRAWCGAPGVAHGGAPAGCSGGSR